MGSKKQILAYLAIVSIPILYGGFYFSTQSAMQEAGLFWVSFIRMGIGFVGLLPFVKRLKDVNRKVLFGNCLIGLVFFTGVAAQSFALVSTSVSNTGFLAALFIIFTPILQRVIYKIKMAKVFIIPIIISGFGYYWMFRDPFSNEFRFGAGEWLGVLGSLMIAFHMIFTEHYIEDNDPIMFAIIQVTILLVLSLIFALIFDPPLELSQISGQTWGFLLYLGIGTTIFTIIFQNWGQKYVNSMVTSLIVVTEPIFATLFGFLLGGENVTPNFITGGVFIMIAAFIATIIQNKVQKKDITEIAGSKELMNE
jgi:drug/metabolite transporter (DMT)-like permease